ncbi:class II aldolase/adducin family protein [Nesterenkonia halotolerans]
MSTAELRDALVAAGRRVVDLGLSPGSSGNLSIKDNGSLYMSPTGVQLGGLDADQLSVISPAGEQIGGAKASKELPLHAAMYQKDPAARAVLHLHSPQATAASCLVPHTSHSALPAVTPYLVMRVGRVPHVPYAPPGSVDLGERILDVTGAFHGALLANHGLIVSGETFDQAIDRAIEIEESCRIYRELFGLPAQWLSDEQARQLSHTYGTHW